MLPYQTIPQKEDSIAIVGIGGAGANILQCFAGSSANNVRLYTMSLDERVGRACGSNVEFIQLGGGLNHGLGCGGDPSVGARAAEESHNELQAMLTDARLLVMVAGLGGGTGSGAAPVLAQMARDAGMFLVSVVVMPFSFEGKRRREQAEAALEEISLLSDIVFCFENDYMEELFRNRSGARAVFEEVDRILARATAAVPMLASSPGFINLGLDELATALENNDSRCIFGTGSGYGPDRAVTAAQAVLESPLVAYHGALSFARTVIVHIAGGDSMSITEIRTVMDIVREALADDEVKLFFGTTVKPHLGDEIRVTLIASVNAEEFRSAIVAPPETERVQPAAPADEIEEFTEPEEELAEEQLLQPDEACFAESPADELSETTDEESADEPELTDEDREEIPEEAEEEEAEDAVPSITVQPVMHQPELMPTSLTGGAEDEADVPTTGTLFPNEGGQGSFVSFSRRHANDDDLDMPPPSRDINNLRGMFPRS